MKFIKNLDCGRVEVVIVLPQVEELKQKITNLIDTKY